MLVAPGSLTTGLVENTDGPAQALDSDPER